MSTIPAQFDLNNVDLAFQGISLEYLQDMFGTKIAKIIWMHVQLVIRRFDPSQVINILMRRFYHEIFSMVNLPFADSRRAVVSFWQKNLHSTLRGLSLPSKSVVRY